jgi:hypothetical protein
MAMVFIKAPLRGPRTSNTLRRLSARPTAGSIAPGASAPGAARGSPQARPGRSGGPHPGRPRAEASPPEGESGLQFAMRSPARRQRGFVGASVTALSPSMPAPGIHASPSLQSARAQAEDPQPLDLLSPPRCGRGPGATGRSPPFRSVGGVPRR